jgi:uroporphyrinogen-III decarboxylase
MTYRERALSVLKGEKPDRIPWFGDLDYWMTYLKKTGGFDDRYLGNGIFDFHRDLGVGFYLQGVFPYQTVVSDVKIVRATDNGVLSRSIVTPYGTLTEKTKYSPESFSTGYIEHYVKTPDDLKALRFIYENTDYIPDYTITEERRARIGDLGLNLCYAPKTPAMELIALQAGIENFSYILADAEDELAETLDLMAHNLSKAVDIACAANVDCIMIPENITSESVGKNIYDRFIAPLHRDWTGRIKAVGKYSFVHLDGTMRGLIREIAASGFDVIEALTPAPVGDIPMGEISKWVDGKNVLWGGLPGAYFTDDITDAQFDEFVIGTLEVMKSDPRYVLGVADQVPPYARAERIRRVAELVEEYG